MECFNSLLLKLREVHEQEVEGWQMKIQELSNKKGWWVDLSPPEVLQWSCLDNAFKIFKFSRRASSVWTGLLLHLAPCVPVSRRACEEAHVATSYSV
ncbi:hypothetical protein JOQ06_019542 [Pogonophryne albipinna]|uniref:DNA endonuclease Ctp1 N-terminal domain-containing protein n=1 Tax=Pogonophryne albipinna TaxID=1090488 RepID=A0AAD6ADZ6_9TELE|nr:hypothetical protein JOQ06_019542 [Pogonophryne albipinna]